MNEAIDAEGLVDAVELSRKIGEGMNPARPPKLSPEEIEAVINAGRRKLREVAPFVMSGEMTIEEAIAAGNREVAFAVAHRLIPKLAATP